MYPALAGGFLTTVPPGKSETYISDFIYSFHKERACVNISTTAQQFGICVFHLHNRQHAIHLSLTLHLSLNASSTSFHIRTYGSTEEDIF